MVSAPETGKNVSSSKIELYLRPLGAKLSCASKERRLADKWQHSQVKQLRRRLAKG